MKLDDLLLKKKEIPILHKSCFQIPIHPKLLDNKISIKESVANEVFEKVVFDWYNDLNDYIKSENDELCREWIENVYLKEKPKIEKVNNRQFFGVWEDNVWFSENGFVSGFSINRNAGGSIYFNDNDFNCEASVPGAYLKFSEEKSREFSVKKIGEFNRAYIYASHNVDGYPGALFLRNWAIMYMNEIFKDIFE